MICKGVEWMIDRPMRRVTKDPLREAIQRLQLEELVVRQPNKAEIRKYRNTEANFTLFFTK